MNLTGHWRLRVAADYGAQRSRRLVMTDTQNMLAGRTDSLMPAVAQTVHMEERQNSCTETGCYTGMLAPSCLKTCRPAAVEDNQVGGMMGCRLGQSSGSLQTTVAKTGQ